VSRFMQSLTAISYARKSIKVKDMSVEASVSYQKVLVDQYAKQNNMEIIKRYNDVGYTGSNINRPELQDMLHDVTHTSVDVLLVYSVDRFGRDLRNNIDTMLKISTQVKKVIFVSEGISSDSEHFKMFFLLLTEMAQD
jgi:DNA invertase Pin-like site-specific DNA recombinase